MAIADLKTALRSNPSLAQKDPTELAKTFKLTAEEKNKVEQLHRQCMGLKGAELETRISKCGL